MADRTTLALLSCAREARDIAFRLAMPGTPVAAADMLDAVFFATLAVVATQPHLDVEVADALSEIAKKGSW